MIPAVNSNLQLLPGACLGFRFYPRGVLPSLLPIHQSDHQNEDGSVVLDVWEILAAPLKQLLITGSSDVVATTWLPGFSQSESLPAFIQASRLGELWPRLNPIGRNLLFSQYS